MIANFQDDLRMGLWHDEWGGTRATTVPDRAVVGIGVFPDNAHGSQVWKTHANLIAFMSVSGPCLALECIGAATTSLSLDC